MRRRTEQLFSLPTAAQLRNEIRAERWESDKQTRSCWLQEARSLPTVADKPKPARREWTVEQKARVLTEACNLMARSSPPTDMTMKSAENAVDARLPRASSCEY